VRSALVALAITAGIVILTHHSGAKPVSSASKPGSPAAQGSAHGTERGEQAIDTARFASGGCVRFPPSSADQHLTVFIDAGHGGIDPGAVGTTTSGLQVEEADLTLPVELDVMADLVRAGFTVVVSRTGATTVARLAPGDESGGLLTAQGAEHDVAARAVCANEANADLLLGVYFDAGASPTNAGCLTGYDPARSFTSSNLRFAQLVQNVVLTAMNNQGWQIPDDGVLADNYLGSASSQAASAYGHLMLLGPAESGYFTTPSQMPGALIEPLFVTDPFEASIAASAHGQQVIAGGIAAAVEQYFAA
jgi:N-acetylmuramoyl-L-alanine amidase